MLPQEYGEVATGVQEHDFVPVSETPDMPETLYSISNPFSCDMRIWPAHVSDSIREYWAPKGSVQCQNLDKDFSESSTRFEGEKYNRQCLKGLFTYTHQLTKQQHSRTWLCYSPLKHAVFGKLGFKDWKHASQLILRHERSSVHRVAMVKLLRFIHTDCHVDAELVRQANAERDYWHAVLERMAETIRFLSERLAFRGSDEVIGLPRNGNYLGIFELLGKFDPFLQQQINQNANKGRGSHFLSV